jgi:hypothetical protein
MSVVVGLLGGLAMAAESPSREGLVLWLDAGDAATIEATAEGRVGCWRDKSGGGRDATPLAGASSPRRLERALNGQGVVRFEGSQALSVPALRAELGPVAVFVVFRRLAEQASEHTWQRLLSCWDGVAANDTQAPCFFVDTEGQPGALAPQVRFCEGSGVGLSRVAVGINLAKQAEGLRGDLAEILVYERGFLSEDAIRLVLDHLAGKWGAAVSRGPSGWTLRGPLPSSPARDGEDLPWVEAPNQAGWTRLEPFWDEFDGSTLDAGKWWPRNPEWAGRQPAWFHEGNVEVGAGMLHLSMRRQEVPEMQKDKGYHTYTSAAVKSKSTVRYGFFEVRARAMRSHGSSAFWFYRSSPEEWTEIDVFEIGGGSPGFERKYNMNLHVFHTPEERRHWSIGDVWVAPWDLAADFHVYGLQWEPDFIAYFVDGICVRRVRNTHWHQDLYLNFDSETMPDWFGLPRDADLPSTFSVDYVRAWTRPDLQAAGK